MKRISLHTISVICLLCVGSVGAEVIDFEDWTLDEDSAWIGPVPEDEGIEQPGRYGGIDRIGAIRSGSLTFVNRFNLRFPDWSGFAISNQTDTATSGPTNQTSAYTGSGAGDGDDNYAIGFGYIDALDPLDADKLAWLPHFDIPAGKHVSSLLVTNTTYAALSILKGDSFAIPFGTGNDPDFFRLSIYGIDENGILLENVVETLLADSRFPESPVINVWTQLDLSSLSAASHLYFNLDSTLKNNAGMVTPAYFAIDNIVLEQDGTGDINRDGHVNLVDADLLCNAIANHAVSSDLDLDDDGFVSFSDIDLFLTMASVLPGDTNFDGSIQFDDFLLFSGNFGKSGSWSHGDFDCNGLVGFPDFLSLSKNFGIMASGTIAVPEPACCHSSLLMAIAMLRLFFLRSSTLLRPPINRKLGRHNPIAMSLVDAE